MKIKVISGHLHTPAANPLDEYKTPEQRDAAAVQAREQHSQAQVSGNAAGGFWHGRKNP